MATEQLVNVKRSEVTLLLSIMPPARERGLSLVEFLIAGAMGIFVLAAVLQSFTALRDNNRVVRSVSDLQETGWAAIRLLERDIHMAAFGGCATGPNAGFNSVANNGPISDLFEEAIRGFTVNDAGNWISGPTSFVTPDPDATDPIPGSDLLTIVRASTVNAAIVEDRMTTFTDPVVVTPSVAITFNQDDIVMISDCKTADVFRITNDPDNGAPEITLAHDATGNSSPALSKRYRQNAQVRKFAANTYYVGDTGRVDAAGNPVSALYRVPHGGERIELVHGVESLQIRYGERLPSGQIRYSDVTTHDIDWSEVISVRLALLVSGDDRTLTEDDANTYDLVGIAVGPSGSGTDIEHPANRKLRRVFSSTIFLQNKVASS